MPAMATWAGFEGEAPELAAAVRERFALRKHATMATLRADGSPRISGTEVEIGDREMTIGSMPNARKALDLRRDPRIALHSPTSDPPEDDPAAWIGEAKIAGLAVELPTGGSSHTFAIDVREVVLTQVRGNALLITSWHEGRGVAETARS